MVKVVSHITTLFTLFVLITGSALFGTMLSATFSAAANAGTPPDEVEQQWIDDWQEQPNSSWLPLTGFARMAYGDWLADNEVLPVSSSLNELRVRLETGYDSDSFTVHLKADALYDHTQSEFNLGVREAVFSGNLSDLLPQQSLETAPFLNNIAVKAGRQILSWGTGDFVFVNDLFRKDWQSFFNGREDQYLKAANDVIKLSYFSPQLNGRQVNIDLIWQPQFSGDRYLNGERFSFYSPKTGQIVSPTPTISVSEPDHSTLAARLYFSYDQSDIAFYVNKGYAGTPVTADNERLYFPGLSSLGASIIAPLGNGLVNFEAAWHDFDSGESGAPSDQTRLLFGYQKELMSRLDFSGQFYLEYNHQNSNIGTERNRQVITSALAYRSNNNKWTTTLFGFYSLNQYDSYIRPSVRYRYNDQLSIAAGANIFNGRPARFFGQFDLNDNGYLRLSYYF